MKDIIESAFPICVENDCVIETVENTIFIQDPNPGKCVILQESSNAHFTILNPTPKALTIIFIDQCIWDHQSGHQKCDFAVTDNSTLAFVEIKDTYKKSSSNKTSAKNQLEETIIRFSEKIDLTQVQIKAVISWSWRPVRPAASTAMQSAALHFMKTYNAILMEGNIISF